MTSADAALTAAVNGEDAAIYAYGVIGPHLTGPALALAVQSELDHRNLRDQVAETMPSPPAASVIYQMPFPITSAATALAAAVTVEERSSALWRAVVVATAGNVRQAALNALIAGAIRAASFRRFAGTYPGTVPFPGLSA
jgi:Domain of unknown function (DUF4439)